MNQRRGSRFWREGLSNSKRRGQQQTGLGHARSLLLSRLPEKALPPYRLPSLGPNHLKLQASQTLPLNNRLEFELRGRCASHRKQSPAFWQQEERRLFEA